MRVSNEIMIDPIYDHHDRDLPITNNPDRLHPLLPSDPHDTDWIDHEGKNGTDHDGIDCGSIVINLMLTLMIDPIYALHHDRSPSGIHRHDN